MFAARHVCICLTVAPTRLLRTKQRNIGWAPLNELSRGWLDFAELDNRKPQHTRDKKKTTLKGKLVEIVRLQCENTELSSSFTLQSFAYLLVDLQHEIRQQLPLGLSQHCRKLRRQCRAARHRRHAGRAGRASRREGGSVSGRQPGGRGREIAGRSPPKIFTVRQEPKTKRRVSMCGRSKSIPTRAQSPHMRSSRQR